MTAVELLVELASLQTAFLTLDEAIKTTNRRVNALDNVVIPKLENTIAYIKARRHAPARRQARRVLYLCLVVPSSPFLFGARWGGKGLRGGGQLEKQLLALGRWVACCR